MYPHQGSQAYRQVGLESSAMGADPHKLIMLLFEGAHSAMLRAKIFMANGDIPARGAEITKAINIIQQGLRAALDHQQGGELSHNLERLYDYMTRTLLQANLQQDIDAITHVDTLMMNIYDAWKQISPSPKA
ncbi:flagellar export chaperone FliS [Biostraticola tofi]|uniref:Flagellar secretion chaperone FliS n=1 Tax=Biostraticola tofi TaxID=466109 RepID=A0A4R3YRH3_9GAMM|nr:flagellar export chaperone FliS [Biostraticola tofi]TCV95565.1 flagellar protein FliS [Biostraticola tofi]